jgi:hypothetical protein
MEIKDKLNNSFYPNFKMIIIPGKTSAKEI